MAARANLAAEPDDSHSNVAWDDEKNQFLSQPLQSRGTSFLVALSLSPMRLSVINDGQVHAVLALDTQSFDKTTEWLDKQLLDVGLQPASSVILPYDLPSDAFSIDIFHVAEEEQRLRALAGWFDFAYSVLSEFVINNAALKPGPSPIRCWPHHFDIATYVSLEEGDFESARGIGVGMSPGDDGYDQPYFYINPWPHLDADGLPALAPPGHWHTDGFVGAIATAEEILSLRDIDVGFSAFVKDAFAIGREKLAMASP
jgi:hypothetical protein